jgi:hypothetical protein
VVLPLFCPRIPLCHNMQAKRLCMRKAIQNTRPLTRPRHSRTSLRRRLRVLHGDTECDRIISGCTRSGTGTVELQTLGKNVVSSKVQQETS